jgi:hypothetical protein
MNGRLTTIVHERGTILRGCLGVLLTTLGGFMLIYAHVGSEFVVTVKEDLGPSWNTVGVAESDQSPMGDWLLMFDVRSPHPVWISEMIVPEPSMVRGVTIGALVRFDTGEVRMLQVLEGAAFCPT